MRRKSTKKANKVRDSESAPPYPDPKAMSLVPVERIERCILLIRGHKVMLDTDLARLYEVTTGNLNLAVKRNAERFPPDFMFQLTAEEADALRLQFAISNAGARGGRRYCPVSPETPEQVKNGGVACL